MTSDRRNDSSQRERDLHALQLFSTELHDGVLQYLVAAAMSVEVLQREWLDKFDAPSEKLDELDTLVRSGLEAGRRLLAGQWTIDFGDESPKEYLVRFCQEAEARSNIRFEANIDLSLDATVPLATTVCRLAGEAINNIVRHSQATLATVAVRQADGNTILEISDNGVGFDSHNIPADRFGVEGMRRRAELVGGSLKIESQDGEGARLLAVIPSTVAG